MFIIAIYVKLIIINWLGNKRYKETFKLIVRCTSQITTTTPMYKWKKSTCLRIIYIILGSIKITILPRFLKILAMHPLIPMIQHSFMEPTKLGNQIKQSQKSLAPHLN